MQHRRLRGRWLPLAVAAVVAVGIAAPVGVLASDRFTDVPESNVFHDDITWLADAGVTLGCNPPANDEYCPSDSVNRGQMAAFMRRLANNRVVDAGTLAGRSPSEVGSRALSRTFASRNLPQEGGRRLLQATMNAPRPGGGLLISGTANFDAGEGFAAGFMFASVGGPTCNAPESPVSWELLADPLDAASFSVFVPVGAGSHRVDLCALNVGDQTEVYQGELVVSWVPYGPSGGSVAQANPAESSMADLRRRAGDAVAEARAGR